MLREIKKVRCAHCGQVFMAADIEDRATARAMEVHCPKCGAVVSMNRKGLMRILERLLGPIVPMNKEEGWI